MGPAVSRITLRPTNSANPEGFVFAGRVGPFDADFFPRFFMMSCDRRANVDGLAVPAAWAKLRKGYEHQSLTSSRARLTGLVSTDHIEWDQVRNP